MAKKETQYEKVMVAVAAAHKVKTGSEHGASSWLAAGLGVSRQTFTGFKNRGRFPPDYMGKICKFTGLEFAQLVDLSDEIAALSRRWRLSVRETELELMRLGLTCAR